MTAMGIPAAAIAFLSCVILVPFVRIYSARHGFFDMPRPLKIHPRPVPRLGGVAIAISLSLGVLFRPGRFVRNVACLRGARADLDHGTLRRYPRLVPGLSPGSSGGGRFYALARRLASSFSRTRRGRTDWDVPLRRRCGKRF